MSDQNKITGDSEEYDYLLKAISMDGCLSPVFVQAVRHIMKRIGPPEDEASLANDAKRFGEDHQID